MAAQGASSSSSSSKLWKYDVFLSFRGEDTRNGFTGHLHTALEEKGYKPFIDEDDLERGEEIKPELLQAIEESRISIIVFSKRYADSSWCLDELVKIMECRSKLGQHVLPIFYHVETSDIRKQEGSLAPMFQKHEEDISKEEDDNKREAKRKRVEQWREALTKAANLSGHDLKNTENGHEAKLIKKIIYENLWKWLPRKEKIYVAKFPVGINSRVQDIISYLSSGGSDDVVMVGIWGMGGLGKTTAAKAIYNQIHHKFQFKSFLPDISNTASKHGLVYLQEELISDVLEKKFEIRSVDVGIGEIKYQFSHRRVLIIMDNIDEVEQLNAIAGNHNWFGPGTRIIITTRDEHLLKQGKVNKTYPAQELNKEEALELLSWHAFGNRRPNEGYLELSKKVVSYCGGLPLALEVLGSFLLTRPIAEWESQLEKLKGTPEGKIIKQLRISFEGLDDTQKAMFLDISCFFIGWKMDYVAKVLDGCGFSTTIGISVLCEQCLVTVEQNKLNMHDLLREMARVIISEKSPSDPRKWSRLWDGREVINVLTNKYGTKEVEGLALTWGYGNAFSTEAFADMKKLRLLHLDGVELKGEYKHLPKELIWLRWVQCPLKSIPDDFFNQPRLVVLDMRWSKLVQVWEGSKSLHNLKTLHLSWSDSLQKSPDSSQVPNLEELILKGCRSLSKIHPSIGHLKRLSLVNLEGCDKLVSLPRDFYKLTSVETLLLKRCSKFREVHEDIGEMISLRTLEAEQTDITEVPPSIVRLKNLTCLSLDHIGVVLKHLPEELIWLCWEECPLKSIPDDFFNQDKLVGLQMRRSKLVQVWEGSKSLHNLKTLDLSNSHFFQKSPKFSQVPNLEELILEWCISLSEIHPSIGDLKRLSLVNLKWCTKLISLPGDFYKLKSVETLLLTGCSKFIELHKYIGEMISLRTLEAERTSIREVPPSIGHLKRLSLVNLNGCKMLSSLPRDFYKLKSVETLKISHYGLISELLEDIGEMISLRTLEADYTAIREVPPSIGHLKRLSVVNLNGCKMLSSLPREFYKLQSVETLLLNGCLQFRELHEDIGEMISLRTLEANNTAIRKVPPSIVRLKNLTRLSLSGVESIHLPHSLHGLTSLKELNLSWCNLADDAILKDLGSLISLQVLDLSWNDFHTLPSLSGLSKLEILRLDNCSNLRTIPDIPPNVKVQHE